MGTTLSDLIQLLIQYMEADGTLCDLTPHFDGVPAGFVTAINWHESYTKGPRLYLKTYIGDDNYYVKHHLGWLFTIGFGTDKGKEDVGSCPVKLVARHGGMQMNDITMVTLELADHES